MKGWNRHKSYQDILVFNPERVKEVMKDKQCHVLHPEEKDPPEHILKLASDSKVYVNHASLSTASFSRLRRAMKEENML